MHMSMASPLTRPSPNGRRVGIRIVTFEACSGFTLVTARRIAQPPKATFVARLQPCRLPDKAARQLPDLSTTVWVEPSSTGNSRLRGARPTTDIGMRLTNEGFSDRGIPARNRSQRLEFPQWFVIAEFTSDAKAQIRRSEVYRWINHKRPIDAKPIGCSHNLRLTVSANLRCSRLNGYPAMAGEMPSIINSKTPCWGNTD